MGGNSRIFRMLGRGWMMKKILVMIFLLLMLFNIAIADENDKVDDEVVNQLDQEGKAKVIVILKDEVEKDYGSFSVMEEVEVQDVREDAGVEVEKEFSVVKGFSLEVDSEELNKLISDDRVEKIEFDKPVSALLIDSVPMINASVVHNLNFGSGNIKGNGQTICIIDTGVNYNHTDLGGCLGSSCKVIDGFNFVTNSSDFTDDHGHGTHVAGIAAANGTLIGVAPEANIVAIKALDSNGNGFDSYIIAGIDYCVNNATLFNIKAIGMSLGSGSYSSACDGENTALTTAVNNAVANNITVIAASGNSGVGGIASPACITNVTSVGSVDKNDAISSFTSRNSLLDLLAPGKNINSTSYDGTYVTNDGTSMAAPHVMGAIALLTQYYSGAGLYVSVPDMIQQLKDSGVKIYDSGTGLTFPRVDVFNALNDTIIPQVDINLSSDTLEFNADNLTISVNYYDVFLDSYNANVSYPDGSLLSDFISGIDLVTDNLTQLGTYLVIGWADDINLNENLTSKTFLVRDTSGLSSSSFTFNSADDNNFTDNPNIEFNISVQSKYNLTNATLSHNFTDWHDNSTINLNINETELIFDNNFGDGVYLWNVEVCDLNSYCVNSGNKTIFADLSNPIVNAVNTTSYSTNNVALHYNVSDYGINNCRLFVDDIVNGSSDDTISIGADQTFSRLLHNGDYNWSVDCTDKVEKVGVSDTIKISVSCAPSWGCDDYASACNSSSFRSCETGGWVDDNNCGVSYTGSNLVSCTFSSGSSGGSGEGSSGGSSGGAVVTATDTSSFSFQANEGDKKKFSISKDVGISGLEIDFKNAKSGASIVVEKVDNKPSTVSSVPNVYKYVEIDTNIDEADIEGAKIEFKVETSWINVNAAGQSTNIFLSRWKDNKWVKLETLTAGIDGNYQKYIAYTSGFSYFAVSADKTAAPVLTTTGDTVAEEEEIAGEVKEEAAKEEEVAGETIFSQFTGFVTTAATQIYSPYSLGILGIIVVLLGGFLFLRFRGKITRTKGKKDSKFLKLKWMLDLGLLNFFKKKNKIEKGKWHDLEKAEEKKAEENYIHDFEIKRDVNSADEKIG